MAYPLQAHRIMVLSRKMIFLLSIALLLPPSLQASSRRMTLSTCDHFLGQPELPGHTHNGRPLTASSLRGHIVRVHFQPRTMFTLGVALYDIEIAKYRSFDLTWVVQQAYLLVERSNQAIIKEIQTQFYHTEDARSFSASDYRTIMVKNLKLIESYGLAQVDWDRVEKSQPGARKMSLNLQQDTQDLSFFFFFFL